MNYFIIGAYLGIIPIAMYVLAMGCSHTNGGSVGHDDETIIVVLSFLWPVILILAAGNGIIRLGERHGRPKS